MTQDTFATARQAVMPATAIAMAALIHVLWGGNTVAVKIGLEAVPPLWSGFVRFTIGVLCVVGWALISGLRLWPRSGEWRPLAVLSIMFTVQIGTMNWGFGLTSGIMGSILLSTFPLWAVIFGIWLLPHDRLTRWQLVGLPVAFTGVLLVLTRNTDLSQLSLGDLGNVIVLFSAALLGLRAAFAGRLVSNIDPACLTVWMMALSLPIFAIGGALTETVAWDRLGPGPILALVYQGAVIAGFCFSVNYVLMRRYNPSVIASFGFVEPIVGVLVSAWLLNEALTWTIAGGALAVGLGLLLLTRRG